MDHFESIICTLLESKNYWVRQSFKVEISKEDKREIGKHSIPRPEIDLLGFNFSENRVLALEVKSFFDSYGVRLNALQEEFAIPQGKYKLFTCSSYRKIVIRKLKQQLIESGMANTETRIQLGLAAGNVYRNQKEEVREHLNSQGFVFWSPREIKRMVEKLASQGYENNAAVITAKILMRS